MYNVDRIEDVVDYDISDTFGPTIVNKFNIWYDKGVSKLWFDYVLDVEDLKERGASDEFLNSYYVYKRENNIKHNKIVEMLRYVDLDTGETDAQLIHYHPYKLHLTTSDIKLGPSNYYHDYIVTILDLFKLLYYDIEDLYEDYYAI
jgi:hypothetical protein